MLLHFAAGNGAEAQAPVSLHKTVGRRVQSELTTVFYISRGPVCCWNHFYGCWWTHGNFLAKQPCHVPKSSVVGVIAGLCLPGSCERGSLWSVTGCAVSTMGRMPIAEGQAHQSDQQKCGKSSLLHPAVACSHIGVCIKGTPSGTSKACFPLKKEVESWQRVCS